MLNLGCGERCHPDWVNIDFSWRAALRRMPLVGSLVRGDALPNYLNHDLRKGIPFATGSVDVTYASHVLEHLWPEDARTFLLEMKRVLRPDGTLRLVVPDLEQTARDYLSALDVARTAGPNDVQAKLRYEWSVIWLLDQLVRRRPGGRMLEWLRQNRDTDFVRGMDGIFKDLASHTTTRRTDVVGRLIRRYADNRDPANTGELHRWMYDSHSLGQLLIDLGYRNVEAVGPLRSRIPNWVNLNLDSNPDGTPHQPGSVWMEASR
jgi:SAM-dependent methyltransferase